MYKMKEKINPILKKKKIFCEKDTAYKEDLFQYTSYQNKKKNIKIYYDRYQNRLLFFHSHCNILPVAYFTRILNSLIKIVAYTYSGACNDRCNNDTRWRNTRTIRDKQVNRSQSANSIQLRPSCTPSIRDVFLSSLPLNMQIHQ